MSILQDLDPKNAKIHSPIHSGRRRTLWLVLPALTLLALGAAFMAKELQTSELTSLSDDMPVAAPASAAAVATPPAAPAPVATEMPQAAEKLAAAIHDQLPVPDATKGKDTPPAIGMEASQTRGIAAAPLETKTKAKVKPSKARPPATPKKLAKVEKAKVERLAAKPTPKGKTTNSDAAKVATSEKPKAASPEKAKKTAERDVDIISAIMR